MHTLGLVRDFLQQRGYDAALRSLPEVPVRSSQELLRNLSLDRIIAKRGPGPGPATCLELVVDTLLKRTRVLRKYERSAAQEAPTKVTVAGTETAKHGETTAAHGHRQDEKIQARVLRLSDDMGQLVSSMHALLLGRANGEFMEPWRTQGFAFSEHPNLPYGLHQRRGGPCGVMAVVQSYFLRGLLSFSDDSWDAEPLLDKELEDPSRRGVHRLQYNWTTARTTSNVFLFSSARRDRCLISALAHVLWGTRRSDAGVTVVLPSSMSRPGPLPSRKMLPEALRCVNVETFADLRSCLEANYRTFASLEGCGVILLVYSAVLTAGIDAIKGMMDHTEATLIGGHGYCTQELVNLMLFGQACANLFDGVQSLGDGADRIELKGVQREGPAPIGLLCHAEAQNICQVGNALKQPACPIWLAYMESHYTTIFAMEKIGPPEGSGAAFSLYYYDGLANQDEVIQVNVQPGAYLPVKSKYDLVPPLDETLRTRWPDAQVDWVGTEPLL